MEADMKGQTKDEEKRMDNRCNLRDGIDGFGCCYVVAIYLKVIWSSFSSIVDILEYLLCYTQLQYHSYESCKIHHGPSL